MARQAALLADAFEDEGFDVAARVLRDQMHLDVARLRPALEDLVASGPFAPIFARHDYPGEHVNWLGAA